jgi:hypothetical protein
MKAPKDTSGSKNAIQSIASTITYLQRYTLFAATGLAADDQDDDGKAAGAKYIDDKQKSQILDMLTAIGYEPKHPEYKKFLEYMKVKSVDEIPADQFKKAFNAIEHARKLKADLALKSGGK